MGLGTATIAALKYGLERGYDRLVTMDADFSHPPRYLPDLLAGLEQAVRALASEITRTRRRANALEYVLIPDLREAKRTIVNRLEEISRSDTSRLMKVKQMLLEREEEAA